MLQLSAWPVAVSARCGICSPRPICKGAEERQRSGPGLAPWQSQILNDARWKSHTKDVTGTGTATAIFLAPVLLTWV